MKTATEIIRVATPQPLRALRRRVLNFRRETPLYRFVVNPPPTLLRTQALTVAKRFIAAHDHIDCAHTHAEMDAIVRAILAVPASVQGCIVEAGCFKGGSTAKLSIAAKLTGRKLFAFDSFEGLPDNVERHGLTIHGETPNFSKGRYEGALEEVKENVRRFGEIGACEFVKGWFDRTMSQFHQQIAVAFIDVDLVSSTRTCLQYLYPLLVPGGSIFSHDGHLPLCAEAMNDDEFWACVVGYPKPAMPGLGTVKLVRMTKPVADSGSGR
jgi:O-methyltransferase